MNGGTRVLDARQIKMAYVLLTTLKRSYSSELPIRVCFGVLGVPNNSDQERVRVAYIELVKKYHPDSKNPEADSAKFQEIETAYRTIQEKFAKERFNVNEGEGEYGLYYKEGKGEDCEIEELDIKHTAPQHRQYLSHDGIGLGTPSQRERQFLQYRAAKAAESVSEYRISRTVNMDVKAVQVRKEKAKVKDIRTGLGMDRLVEDLIQESMTRGEFDNLSGSGKPLKNQATHNPYVDFVTRKMNEVLIDNGFTPQWITLQKEIRDRLEDIKGSLEKTRGKLGPLPLTKEDDAYWRDFTAQLEAGVKDLNAKIDFYNLVVPILNKQMTHVRLHELAEKTLKEGKPSEKPTGEPRIVERLESSSFLGKISSILWR